MKTKNKAISTIVVVTVALSILMAFSATASAADILTYTGTLHQPTTEEVVLEATLVNDSTTPPTGISGVVNFTLDGTYVGNAITNADGVATVNIGTYPVGVYAVSASVGCSGSEGYLVSDALLAVYDLSTGFVTGGGWIISPAGAVIADDALSGKANFGFVSKYKKGAYTPTGTTQFRFKVADFNFHSESYDWLVIAGEHAKYKGTGTINGEGEYGFMLTATDGDFLGVDGSDTFRIKIWDTETETVIYDNKPECGDTGYEGTELGGGSIVIHKAK